MMLRSTLRVLAASLFAMVVLLATDYVVAASLPAPTDKPILTVTGKITCDNKDGTASIRPRDARSAGRNLVLHRHALVQRTRSKFEGVPLAKLLDAVGATGDRIVSFGLNDLQRRNAGRRLPAVRCDRFRAEARRRIRPCSAGDHTELAGIFGRHFGL